MATIIPLNNTQFTTAGERRFYQFLRDALKPDSQCFAWYSPSIDGLEPDFVVYTPEVGLVVFEVKDWLLKQIQEADQRSFALLLPDGRAEKRTHPLQQAREYMFAILNRIKTSCSQLLSSNPHYQGKARLPLECAVVFSNITREEFCSTNLPTVLPAEKVLFADDLALALTVKDEGMAARKMRERLAAMLPPKFPFQLSPSDISALRDVLWPHVRIVLPKRAGLPQEQNAEESIMRLDAQQESLARRLDAADAIIQGPAGSGKTLVLVHKAVQELRRLRNSGSDLPVLLICFNLTLVHYLKRLLAGQRAPLGKNDILVTHFYDFCRSLLAEPLAYENEDAAYYKLVVQMAVEAAPDAAKYGAIFVDEGQDLSDDMMDVLNSIRADDAPFWVACDTAQELYATEQQWFSSKKFRKFSLTETYRASQSLAMFCEKIVHRGTPPDSAQAEAVDSFAVKSVHGDPPALRQVDNLAGGAVYIVNRVQTLHGQGVPYSEMMLLYASSRHPSAPGESVPEFLRDCLEGNGILVNWASRNAQSKSAWDITTDSVSLSTIHSMKGLDAMAVFVWGLDALEASRIPQDKQRTLAYVACTRARRHLEILYCDQTPLIRDLLSYPGNQA
jgi:hypothetical protein